MHAFRSLLVRKFSFGGSYTYQWVWLLKVLHGMHYYSGNAYYCGCLPYGIIPMPQYAVVIALVLCCPLFQCVRRRFLIWWTRLLVAMRHTPADRYESGILQSWDAYQAMASPKKYLAWIILSIGRSRTAIGFLGPSGPSCKALVGVLTAAHEHCFGKENGDMVNVIFFSVLIIAC